MIEMGEHATRPLAADETLARCLRAVLDDPGDDGPRRAYADRLAELGHHQDAQRVHEQLAEPEAYSVVAGAEVGLPLAAAVAFRRGFAEAATVGRDDLVRLGEILSCNPVTSLRIIGTGALLVISRDGPLWVARMRASVLAPLGPGQPGLCVGRRDWECREGMVAGIGAWAAEAIPDVQWRGEVSRPAPEPVLLDSRP